MISCVIFVEVVHASLNTSFVEFFYYISCLSLVEFIRYYLLLHLWLNSSDMFLVTSSVVLLIYFLIIFSQVIWFILVASLVEFFWYISGYIVVFFWCVSCCIFCWVFVRNISLLHIRVPSLIQFVLTPMVRAYSSAVHISSCMFEYYDLLRLFHVPDNSQVSVTPRDHSCIKMNKCPSGPVFGKLMNTWYK